VTARHIAKRNEMQLKEEMGRAEAVFNAHSASLWDGEAKKQPNKKEMRLTNTSAA